MSRGLTLKLVLLGLAALVGQRLVVSRDVESSGGSHAVPVGAGSTAIAYARVMLPEGDESAPSVLSLLHGDEVVYSTDTIGFSRSGDVITYPAHMHSPSEGEHRFAGLVRGAPMQATVDLEFGMCMVFEATPGGEVAHCSVRLLSAAGERIEAGTVRLNYTPGPMGGMIRWLEWTGGRLEFDLPVGGRYYLSARSPQGREWGPLPDLIPGQQELEVTLQE